MFSPYAATAGTQAEWLLKALQPELSIYTAPECTLGFRRDRSAAIILGFFSAVMVEKNGCVQTVRNQNSHIRRLRVRARI